MTAVSMTPHDQLLLELINRARADPTAEAARYGIGLNDGISGSPISSAAKQPLAPNQLLTDIAGAHSQDMLDNNYFDHTNLAGQSPSARGSAVGYPSWVGENISWGGTTGPVNQISHVYQRHQSLFESPGHRQNMLRPTYEEFGVGVRFGLYTHSNGTTYNSSMVTENFGEPGIGPVLTGVVFTDASDGSADDDDFYSIGEQVSSGTVTATNTSTGAYFTDDIGTTGGYALHLNAGTYNVVVTNGTNGETYLASNVVVGSANVKVDFETTTAATANTAPTLGSLSDLAMLLNQQQASVALSAYDADGNALTFSATVDNYAYHLDQTLGLTGSGNLSENWGGLGEKWLRDGSSQWHFITPSGQLFRWNGSSAGELTGDLVASLDPLYHADASLLYAAQSGLQGPSANVNGAELTVAADATFDGTFVVTVTVSDGIDVDAGTFLVSKGEQAAHAVDQAHGISTDGDFRLNWGGRQEKWLSGTGNDEYFITPDGMLYQWNGSPQGNLTGAMVAKLDARFYERPSLLYNAEAYYLDVARDLSTDGNYFENWGGLGEKWLRGANNQWHFITPDGTLYEWDGSGTSNLTGTTVATLDASHHHDPRLLADAHAFYLDAQLEFQPPASYYENWGGLGEKWIQSDAQGWFYITSDGSLYRWDQGSPANLSGEQVATLDTRFHEDPGLLHDALDLLDNIFASWGA